MSSKDFIISAEHSGINIESFLMKKNNFSRRLITRLKRQENGIMLNGARARTIDRLSENDVLTVAFHDEKQLESNDSLNVPIIYEDDDVIVFDKPVNMPVHPSIKHQGDTLGNFFSAHCQGLSFRPINRLDRDTSGLCVCAKNAHSANLLQKSIEKTYFAVVCGALKGNGTIDAPIARETDSIILRTVREDGQRAITHYQSLKYNNKYSLLKVKLETGRTHQIRVHMAHIGFPLAGDNLYGGDMSDISCQALHCGEIAFIHPVTKEKISLQSPIRNDMKALVI